MGVRGYGMQLLPGHLVWGMKYVVGLHHQRPNFGYKRAPEKGQRLERQSDFEEGLSAFFAFTGDPISITPNGCACRQLPTPTTTWGEGNFLPKAPTND